MSTRISEFYGEKPGTAASFERAATRQCPYVDKKCKKKHGACSLEPVGGQPVIICPNRLYAEDYRALKEIAVECYGPGSILISPKDAKILHGTGALTGQEVLVYGQGWGGEIGIKAPSSEDGADGTFKIDFLLVKVDPDFTLTSVVAVEVQSIDTTDSYRDVAGKYYSSDTFLDDDASHHTDAGFNWENVTKRILPQVIYKGHALRRERLAQHGLYFVVPEQVYEKIMIRVGGKLLEYPKGPGTVTFKCYTLGPLGADNRRTLVTGKSLTTSVEQIAFAFVSPQNLPKLGVYEEAIREKLLSLIPKSKSKT